MPALQELKQDLRSALNGLYDPLYQPSDLLREVTGCQAGGAACVREALIQAIRELEPSASVPCDAPAWRLHQVLHDRYLASLTQAEVASHLGISDRYLREEQGKAIHLLARRLWERARYGPSPSPAVAPADEQALNRSETPAATPQWLSQVRAELEALRKDGAAPLADVGEIIRDVAETGRAIAAVRHVALEVPSPPADYKALAHPTILRQIALEAIRELSRCVPGGRVAVEVRRAAGSVTMAGSVTIALTASPIGAGKSPDLALVEELIVTNHGCTEINREGDAIALRLVLRAVPSAASRATVLVVDDNEDLVDLYRPYVAKTRYDLVHIPEAQHLFQAIEACAPDVIVQDVMLPDADGWKLLAKMHEHPLTRATPIVVCSVIRDEELALALGATRYLAKPVRRKEFLGALDEALSQVASGSPPTHARRPTAS
jgi:CheY-like chemotaxis protein